MSQSSFPRPEHAAALRRAIEERVRQRGLQLEVAERGLNQLKCQYKFGLRRGPQQDWAELAIHFQIAVRLESSASDAELSRLVDRFLDRRFP